MGAAEAIQVVGDTWEAIQLPTVNPRIMKVIMAESAMRVAGAVITKAGTITAAGVMMAVVGTTKTASCSYAGKPSLRHVPGVGA